MNVEAILNRIQKHPESHKIGMIASHLGVVRGNSRNGKEVNGIQVDYDQKILNDIINKIKELPGIIDVIVEINEGRLEVGEPILFVAVGGDIREHVFPALIKAVDLIKKDASKKREIYQRG
jgi:molybdopterin synthase catalytic subunit